MAEPLFLDWGTYWLSGPTFLWLELGPGGTTYIERWVWSLQNDSVVAGGGAIEMELSKYLRDYSRTIPGKQQLLIGAYAKALEIIPRQLCDNAGFDATNILNKLRARHAQGGMWYGVDIHNEDIADNFEAFVWEPAMVRINALTAASEAACLIVSVDENIKNPCSTVDAPQLLAGAKVVSAPIERHLTPHTSGWQAGCRVCLHSLSWLVGITRK